MHYETKNTNLAPKICLINYLYVRDETLAGISRIPLLLLLFRLLLTLLLLVAGLVWCSSSPFALASVLYHYVPLPLLLLPSLFLPPNSCVHFSSFVFFFLYFFVNIIIPQCYFLLLMPNMLRNLAGSSVSTPKMENALNVSEITRMVIKESAQMQIDQKHSLQLTRK